MNERITHAVEMTRTAAADFDRDTLWQDDPRAHAARVDEVAGRIAHILGLEDLEDYALAVADVVLDRDVPRRVVGWSDDRPEGRRAQAIIQ